MAIGVREARPRFEVSRGNANRCDLNQHDHFPVMVTVPEADPGSAWLGESTILFRLPPFAFGARVKEPDPLGVFDPPALHVASGAPLEDVAARVTSSG